MRTWPIVIMCDEALIEACERLGRIGSQTRPDRPPDETRVVVREDLPPEGAGVFFTDYSITPAELAVAMEERGFNSVWPPTSSCRYWTSGPATSANCAAEAAAVPPDCRTQRAPPPGVSRRRDCVLRLAVPPAALPRMHSEQGGPSTERIRRPAGRIPRCAPRCFPAAARLGSAGSRMRCGTTAGRGRHWRCRAPG